MKEFELENEIISLLLNLNKEGQIKYRDGKHCLWSLIINTNSKDNFLN